MEVWRLRLELWFDSTMVYVDYINQLLLDNQVEAGPLDIDKPDIDFGKIKLHITCMYTVY